MKWIPRAFLLLVVAWFGFYASPYVAMYQFGQAIESADHSAVRARLDMIAVRRSLANQLITAHLAGKGRPAERQEPLASFASFVADPLVAEYVTEDAVVGLLARGSPSSLPSGAPTGNLKMSDLRDLLITTEHRGLTKVLFRLPPDRPRTHRFGLLFRLSGLTWRIAGVELPEPLKQRILSDLRARGKNS
jgi:hypothetical protein